MSTKRIEKDYIRASDTSIIPDFGRVMAENDPNLADYYIAPERYLSRAVNLDDAATFFVGPKGIGKSAILQMIRLQKPSEEQRIISIGPDDLAFSALANIEANTPLLADAGRNQWLFKSLWDYVLSLEILRREYQDRWAYESALHRFFRSDNEKKAKKLLEISLDDRGSNKTLSGRILQIIDEVELSAEYQDVKVSGRLDVDSAAAGENLKLLGLVNSVAKSIGDVLKHPYYLLIDDLDLHWTNSPIQNAFIAALFLSLRNFSKPHNLKCVVAIKDEIYRSLPLKDRDKFPDWVCRMRWDAPTVKSMVAARVVYRLKCRQSEVWGGVFPENGFDRMWKHSQGRPRELVRLASLSFMEARTQGHKRVEDADISAAIIEFAKERLLDLASEVQHDYPSFNLLANKFEGWPREFSMAKFAKDFAGYVAVEVSLHEGNSARYSWAGGYADDAKGLGRIFLSVGFLQIKASRNAAPRMYDVENPVEILDESWFAINPVYTHALGLIMAADPD